MIAHLAQLAVVWAVIIFCVATIWARAGWRR